MFLEKFLANNFALSDAEDNTSRPSNSGSIADLPWLRLQEFVVELSGSPKDVLNH